MIVHVIGAPLVEFVRQDDALCEMRNSQKEPRYARNAVLERQTERLQIGNRAGDKHSYVGGNEGHWRLPEDVDRPFGLRLIRRIRNLLGCQRPDRIGIDTAAELAQRFDLTPDEGV